MASCPACGKELPGEFPFCPFCASPLGEPEREQRKTVTVVFCDVTGSTAMGESADPEVVRARLARYFERMREILERHGGTVEKFIGDAVMAVFGVPAAHEDDALRACRAAVEMQDALPELGIDARIGINTGEVVTGTAERLATGDAVNVAARLEQAALPGTILIGVKTYELTRNAIEVEELEPLSLKGKDEPVVALRLLSVRGGEDDSRAFDAPMVGRETELRRLRDAFDQAIGDRSCQLFTILGPAGVGKSRLVAEFLGSLAGAVVVRGRCLPYGEGITYWPVVEVLKQMPEAGTDPRVAETIGALLGDEQLASSSEEIAWAFRKRLQAAAAHAPVVCVFDDLHWGEETFLDLLEHVADLSRDAPILLVCMARPELLDRRAGWAGGKLNATNVLLEPLAPAESEQLIESLTPMEGDVRGRILEAAEGNPLFVEEMVALVRESGDGELVVPPTIQALLAARLDQLEVSERSVLERGAVEGRVFHCGAVQALAPGERQLQARLSSLVRKELVRPAKGQLPGEEAFRFRHLLIRDAAYDGLPKATRAELHERFSRWLEQHGSTLVELNEILGYHLEQAHRYRAELGAPDEDLSARAAECLGRAGLRAHRRSDVPAAVSLLGRACHLLAPGDSSRTALQIELGASLGEAGRFEEAQAVLGEARRDARSAGDRAIEARARVEELFLRHSFDPVGVTNDAEAAVRELVPLFEEVGDNRALARVWQLAGLINNMRCRFDELSACMKRALVYARQAGDERAEGHAVFWIPSAGAYGPLPAEEGIRQCEALLDEVSGRPFSEASVMPTLGMVYAMVGRATDARTTTRQGREMIRELGLEVQWGATAMGEAWVEFYLGDPVSAERLLREGAEMLERLGERSYLSTVAVMLAQALNEQGRHAEAEEASRRSEELAAPDDIASQAGWRTEQARALAHRGELVQAERLARQAIQLTTPTDGLDWIGHAHASLAEVLELAGRREEAVDAAARALEVWKEKGIVLYVERAQAMLARLRAHSSATA